jgi:hypothetical protein
MAYGANRARLAFLYGTALAVGGFAAGTFAVCSWLDVWSFRAFSQRMRTAVPELMERVGVRNIVERYGFADPPAAGLSAGAGADSTAVTAAAAAAADSDADGGSVVRRVRVLRSDLVSLGQRVIPALGNGPTAAHADEAAAAAAAAEAAAADEEFVRSLEETLEELSAPATRTDKIAAKAAADADLEAVVAGTPAGATAEKKDRKESVWARGWGKMTAMLIGGPVAPTKPASAADADADAAAKPAEPFK